jgi:hypothetical protein
VVFKGVTVLPEIFQGLNIPTWSSKKLAPGITNDDYMMPKSYFLVNLIKKNSSVIQTIPKKNEPVA